MKEFFGFKMDKYGEWIDDIGPYIPYRKYMFKLWIRRNYT